MREKIPKAPVIDTFHQSVPKSTKRDAMPVIRRLSIRDIVKNKIVTVKVVTYQGLRKRIPAFLKDGLACNFSQYLAMFGLFFI